MIRVLAIDDEPLALQQLATYIKKIPFLELVTECQSAIEAKEILNNENIDAIFCDINMPDLNGMDFVKSLSTPPLQESRQSSAGAVRSKTTGTIHHYCQFRRRFHLRKDRLSCGKDCHQRYPLHRGNERISKDSPRESAQTHCHTPFYEEDGGVPTDSLYENTPQLYHQS